MQRNSTISGFFITLFCLLSATLCHSSTWKVLVVHSYGPQYPMTVQTSKGIEAVLGSNAEIKHLYLNYKTNPAKGKQKAEEAYGVYTAFQPDGIIATEEPAQSLFVAPFLRDKVKTPVMFCGINTMPAKFGYPASNVSGIWEQAHLIESISFARELVPSIAKIGSIMKENDKARMLVEMIRKKSSSSSVKIDTFELVNTEQELRSAAKALRGQVDALYVMSLIGITDAQGALLPFPRLISIVNEEFAGPTFSSRIFPIKLGALCGVVVSVKEQGAMAAKMLIQAMKGTPVKDIAIVKKTNGKKIINITTLKALKIKPSPDTLRSAQLVRGM